MATGYRDWHGRRVEVSQRTLDAILAALDEPPGQAAAVPAAPDGLPRRPGRGLKRS